VHVNGRLARALAPVAVALSLTASGLARADDADADAKAKCAASYEATQSRRKQGKLRDAREQALACSQASCPAVVRKDCTLWLGELDQLLPSIVVAARDAAGQETADVKVTIDGAVVADRLEGKAIPIDPGEHQVRLEHAGDPLIELKILVNEGDKGKRVEGSFAPKVREKLDPSLRTAPPPPPPSWWTGRRVAGLVIAGVGLGGVAVFATFGERGLAQKNDLEKQCAPNCSAAQIDQIKTKFLIGDLALLGGVVFFGVGMTVFLTAPNAPSRAAVTVGPRGASLGGTF
jgi:hypothetical protein